MYIHQTNNVHVAHVYRIVYTAVQPVAVVDGGLLLALALVPEKDRGRHTHRERERVGQGHPKDNNQILLCGQATTAVDYCCSHTAAAAPGGIVRIYEA